MGQKSSRVSSILESLVNFSGKFLDPTPETTFVIDVEGPRVPSSYQGITLFQIFFRSEKERIER
jgi:hypothetical protein